MFEAVFAEGGAAPDRRRRHLCTPRARGGHASLPAGQVGSERCSWTTETSRSVSVCLSVCLSRGLQCPAAQQRRSAGPLTWRLSRQSAELCSGAAGEEAAGPRPYLQEHADEPCRPPQPESAPIAPYCRMTGGLWRRLGARRVKMDALQPVPACMEPALRPPHGQARHGRAGF